MDEHRQHRVRIVGQLARLAAGLVGPRAALDHRVHVLEVTRVGGQRDGDAAPVARPVGAGRAVVVLHVAGAALGRRGVHRQRLLALELGQDRLVGASDRVGQHVEPAAVRHPEHDLAGAGRGGELDGLVEHRHERVEALDRELLLAEEGLVQVALERLDLGQPLEQRALLLGRERLAVGRRTRSPGAATRAARGRRCARSRRRSCRRRSRAGCGSASANVSPGTATRSTEAGMRRISSAVRSTRGRVERRIADRLGAERVEPRRQVAVHAVGLDERGGGLHGLQQRVRPHPARQPGWRPRAPARPP